ncbi:MAG: TRAP transporter substrate-binding protein [Ostreibacterium sp.]
MNNLSSRLSLIILTVCAMGLSSVQASEKWDMALAYSAKNYHSEIAAEFAKEVTKKTAGELEIITHPGGALFSGPEIFGAVRKGLVPIGERLISTLGNSDPIYELDSLPFLATSFPESKLLYDAQKPELKKMLDKSGMVFLYSIPWPPQGFYTIKAANSKADIAGLKFRAYNVTTSRIAELLGMEPTKIEAAELSQAFATGVAQAMISSGSTGYDRRLWENVNYFYDVRAWLPRNMVMVNKKVWDRLDAKTQKIILKAAAIAETKGWAKAEELSNWYIEQFKKNGMKVNDMNKTLLADFHAAGEKLKIEWLKKAGKRGQAILTAYEVAKAKLIK